MIADDHRSRPDANVEDDIAAWARIKELLADCLEADPEGRIALLASAEAATRARVLQLLAANDAAPRSLESWTIELDADDAAPTARRVGPYRIVGLIGEGGSGLVYEARQDRPERRVALKMLRPSSASPRAIERFRAEVEILGRMQHPGIATILDAGVSTDPSTGSALAVPWLAMELVEGEPITRFAAALPLRAKLELFVELCDAVHYAHQRGVIHRDLKPQNVLVSRGADSRPRVRVLDFGIARVIDSEDAPSRRLTIPGLAIGTPPYMSPEQFSADPDDIDVRSDVYALGVVLYELLTRRLPVEVGASLTPAVARRVLDEAPRPPSAYDRNLRGDIDTIVEHALAKEKERRYPSVSEFAGDVRRFLRDEPISVKPPSIGYTLAKFARRHRGLVVGSAIAALLLVVTVIAIATGLHRTSLERDKANSVVALLRGILASASPLEGGVEVTVGSVLDQTLATLGTGHPREVEATLRRTIGETYTQLQRRKEGLEQLELAAALFRAELGDDHAETLETEVALALAKARPGTADLLARCRSALGADHPISLKASVAHALALPADDSAERVLLDAIARHERALGEHHPQTLAAREHYVGFLQETSRLGAAIALQRDILAILESTLGEDRGETWFARFRLADLLDHDGRYAEAEPLHRGLQDRAIELFGADSSQAFVVDESLAHNLVRQRKLEDAETILLSGVERARRLNLLPQRLNSLAVLYASQGRKADAEEHARRAYEATRVRYGDEAISTLIARDNWAAALDSLGRAEDALPLFEESVRAWTAQSGSDHSDLVGPLNFQANCLLQLGRPDQAEPVYRRAVAIARASLRPDHLLHATSITSLGLCLARLKRAEEAEALLLEAEGLWAAQPVGYRYRLENVLTQLEKLYQATGRPELAAAARQRRDEPKSGD